MHILTVEAIEIYYPEPWRKSPEQVKEMRNGEKSALAEAVGSAIAREQFEQEMPVVFAALSAAWSLAHS
jgi:hypothetical protein